MARNAPCKLYRKGIGLVELFRRFPDDDTAREWIESIVWPDGPYCPRCGSFNVQSGISHRTVTHRCRECRGKSRFSVKMGTGMQSSKLGHRMWPVAACMVTTNLKGVSDMKLHRDLDVMQKSTWHPAHRLGRTHEAGASVFHAPVEADETCMGGKECSKHARDRLRVGRGPVGKMAVADVKDRAPNEIRAHVVAKTDAETLQGFVKGRAAEDATVYADEARAYVGIKRTHESVNHSAGEYVRGGAHTQGMESYRSMLERGHKGVHHRFSPKHLARYVDEFVGRHNVREQDTIVWMAALTRGMVGKRLRYRDLIADNGLNSCARPGKVESALVETGDCIPF